MKLDNCPCFLKTKLSDVANVAANYLPRNIARRASALVMFVALFASVSMAYDLVVVEPSQNINCADLNASANPAYSHMTVNWEFKIDPPPAPPGDTYLLTNADGEVIGGMPENPNMTLGVSMASSTVMDMWQLSWTSLAELNMLVSAVIVKGGPGGANVYTYSGLAYTDSGTFTVPTVTNAISHLSFCFEPFSAVLASYVEVSGRVVDNSGRPIPLALVTLTSVNGSSQSVLSSPRGEFLFPEVEAGVDYQITVEKKHYKFAPKFENFSDHRDGLVLVGTFSPPIPPRAPVSPGKSKLATVSTPERAVGRSRF